MYFSVNENELITKRGKGMREKKEEKSKNRRRENR